jgi:hypothetical protein
MDFVFSDKLVDISIKVNGRRKKRLQNLRMKDPMTLRLGD